MSHFTQSYKNHHQTHILSNLLYYKHYRGMVDQQKGCNIVLEICIHNSLIDVITYTLITLFSTIALLYMYYLQYGTAAQETQIQKYASNLWIWMMSFLGFLYLMVMVSRMVYYYVKYRLFFLQNLNWVPFLVLLRTIIGYYYHQIQGMPELLRLSCLSGSWSILSNYMIVQLSMQCSMQGWIRQYSRY